MLGGGGGGGGRRGGASALQRKASVTYTGPDGKAAKFGRRMSLNMSPEALKEAGVDSDLGVTTALGKMMVEEDMGGVMGKLHRRASVMAEAMVGEADDAEEGANEDSLQTNGEAMVNLLNNCLGSSLVGISFAIMQAGWGTALVCIVFSVLLNKYTLLLNLKTCFVGQIDPSGTAIAEKAYGKTGKTIMVFTYTFFGFFCMVSYISASADCIKGLAVTFVDESTIPNKLVIQLLAWFFLLFPPTLMRSMKSVAVLSFVAFLGGVILVVSLLVVCVMIIIDRGLEDVIANIQWGPAKPQNMLTAGPLLCLAFSIQAGGGVVLATMKDSSDGNVRKVTNYAYLLVISMNSLLGSIAYLAFQEKTKGDVIENLPSSNPVSFLARVCLLDLVVLSYMIMCIPCKISLIEYLYGKNEALQEATPKEYYGVVCTLSVAALCVATVVSDLSLINGLNGAVFTNINAFIFPALLAIKINANPADPELHNPVSILSPSNIGFYAIFLFGSFMLVLGTGQVVNTMMSGSA
jgi:sodium-coupled neutral amino acid transporter 11